MARHRPWAGALEIAALLWLPRPVRAFYLRALLIALRVGDKVSLKVAIRPRDLRALLRVSDGCVSVVELGTGTGWASIALALANPACSVTTYDVRPRPHLDRYLGLLDLKTRERIVLELRAAEEGPVMSYDVDLLFIDVGLHTKELTSASYRAWESSVVRGGIVVFHDYSDWYPEVREAVEELGLEGEIKGGGLFVRHTLDA